MNNEYLYIVNNFNYSIEDAKTIIDFITKVDNKRDFNSINWFHQFESNSARWEVEELVAYVNEDSEENMTIEEILKRDDVFCRLPSGLIFSWKY